MSDEKKITKNTVYYDHKCVFCSKFVSLLKKIYPIRTESSWDNSYAKNLMITDNTWVYVDKDLHEWTKGEALLQILKTKKISYLVYALFNNKVLLYIINNIYTYIAKNRNCSLKRIPNVTLIKKIFLLICVIGIIVSFLFRQTILYNTGNIFFDGKLYNITLAKRFFTLADMSDNTKIIWLNYQLSRIYFIEGDLNKSVTYANKELRYHPENCRTYYIRGLAFGYLDRLDAAIEDFKKFNSCFPLTWAGHNDLAWFYFRKGDILSMRKVIEPMLLMHLNNPWVLNTYGLALLNSGEEVMALKAFKEAKMYADGMRNEDWGIAYPGNDPIIYKDGLKKMNQMVEENIELAEKRVKDRDKTYTQELH